MAFKNVARPRFWINTTQWIRTVLDLKFTDNTGTHELNPANKHGAAGGLIEYILGEAGALPGRAMEKSFGAKSYLAILGHNLTATDTVSLHSWNNSSESDHTLTDIVNGDTAKKGFSIWTFDGDGMADSDNTWRIKFADPSAPLEAQISSAAIGTYYDIPRSPDLSVKMTWDYDGIDTYKSIGGGTFSNARYTGPADFGSDGAWEQGGADRIRTGRRSWDISFSYLTAEEAHPVNSIQDDGAETSTGYGNNVSSGTFAYNIFTGTDLYTQVINRTIGSHIPFIFQPDKDNNNPDQFAICRFDQKSFTYDKISDNLYKIQFKIRESW